MATRPFCLLAPSLSAALLLVACGGGGGSGPATGTGVQKTLFFPSAAALDGHVDGFGGIGLGAVGPQTGDTGPTDTRQILSFDHSAIPAGAAIESAVLQIVQANVIGAPFATLGTVQVDHVDYGTTPGAATYAGQTLTAAVGTLSTTPALGGRQLDVVALVRADRLAGRTRTQLRLQFTTANDGDAFTDAVQFADAEGSCCTPSPAAPGILVTWRE